MMHRRDFVQRSSILGLASLLGVSGRASAEPPPEVKKIRLIDFPAICVAPANLAEDLLLAEGFEEVEYVKLSTNKVSPIIGEGHADIYVESAPALVNFLASQETIVALGGVHAGCYELLAKTHIRAIRDLKGRSIAISAYGSTEHIFVSGIASYVGLDPRKDIDWRVAGSSSEAKRAFAEGEVDAFLGFAPYPQKMRAKNIGHTILNTTEDRPWSQYFCCMLIGNREFVRRNPVATKRALRALLKATDICAADPAKTARFMVQSGRTDNYQLALDVLSELPYRRWRDASPEDTLRFHALRLHEAGIIQTNPEKLIARGTDWRFFNELRKELKA
jgi:NitT/TauT family transport system substrate-binding protein